MYGHMVFLKECFLKGCLRMADKVTFFVCSRIACEELVHRVMVIMGPR